MTARLTQERSPLCETPAEELASSITHGIGVALSIAALVVMVVLAQGSALNITACAIFGSSLIALYLSSTLYHSFSGVRTKQFFQWLDHACIYLLIAGSYTPVTLIALGGAWGWTLFGIVWALALSGILIKAFLKSGRDGWISTVLYLAMGWLVIIAIKPLIASLTPGGLALIVAGGVAYSAGVLFFVWEKLRFNHAIWHLFVLGGSTCHALAIMLHVL